MLLSGIKIRIDNAIEIKEALRSRAAKFSGARKRFRFLVFIIFLWLSLNMLIHFVQVTLD